MKIAIIGAGVVGQATGMGFQRLGHKVTFYDLDTKTVELLLEQGYDASFHKLMVKKPQNYDVIFVCVTETAINVNEFNLWREAYEGLYVIRSTVPIGTTEELIQKCVPTLGLCHNPEFLRESVSEYEFMNPHKIIIGECCQEHGAILEELYKPFNVPIVRVDTKTSEMIKLASNAYLATQISFWNQMHLICRKLGVNSHILGKACSLDPRISEYGASMHGRRYGGNCLPKDLDNLIATAKKEVATPYLLEAVKKINQEIEEMKK